MVNFVVIRYSRGVSRCMCHSGKEYKDCCQPFHEGRLPDHALQLMRSRYSAYAMGLVDYIVDTGPDDASRENISQFCRSTEFLGLEILEFLDGEKEATVTFKAILKNEERDLSFVEKSSFVKTQNRWRYVEGIVS